MPTTKEWKYMMEAIVEKSPTREFHVEQLVEEAAFRLNTTTVWLRYVEAERIWLDAQDIINSQEIDQ